MLVISRKQKEVVVIGQAVVTIDKEVALADLIDGGNDDGEAAAALRAAIAKAKEEPDAN